MEGFFDRKMTRGCLGLLGLGIAGLSLAVLVTGIVQTVQGPTSELPGAIGASVCMLVTGTLGGVLCWYGYVGVFGERRLTGRLEDQILEAAKSSDGRVTVAQVAAETDLSMAESEAVLTRLAKNGLVRMEIDDEGDSLFLFPGLDESQAQLDRRRLEEEIAEVRTSEHADEPDRE